MAKAVASSARFRQRKISVKQTLQIIPQSDIPDLEDEQQRELQQVETGVEKGEEEEHHLQAAINASKAASAGAKVAQVYIPTPDASQKWKEYDRYYPKDFQHPTSYIRISATVEETSGCPYCMDEEDEEFLKEFNRNKPQAEQCTEDEFEMVMHKFEATCAERQPFLTMDPTQLAPLDELSALIVQRIQEDENDPSSPEFLLRQTSSTSSLFKSNLPQKSTVASFKKFSHDIYPHFRKRKIDRGGHSITPVPKAEESAEKDDNDPYVCFRRREMRQVRKTRRTDQQSSERLRKLQSEMESAKRLMQMIVQREQMRKEALQMEWDIFEKRCTVKTVKRKLGVHGEDEDLVAHKKKKVEEPSIPKKLQQEKQEKQEKQEREKEKESKASTTATSAAAAAAAAQPAQADKSGQQPLQATNPASASNAAIHQVPPYVRLPISKIPDMEMQLLDQFNREKEVAIRSAVKNKLKQRHQQDREWVNYTDNPFVPYCDYFDPDVLARNNLKVIDQKHASYSSLGAPYPPSCDVPLQLPLANSLGSSYASRVEASPILLRARFGEDGDLDVTARLEQEDLANSRVNVPRSSALSMRKRRGRGGRIMVDRRGLVQRPPTPPAEDDYYDNDGDVSMTSLLASPNTKLASQRLEDRYKYDSDIGNDNMEFSSTDPSRLNGISEETQSIRFGSMLLSKSFDSYREAYQQRQYQLQQWQKQMQQQQQQQQQEEAAAAAAAAAEEASQSPTETSAPSQRSLPTSVSKPNGNGNGNGKGGNNNGSSSTPIRNGGMAQSMKMGTPPTRVEG